MEAKTVKLPEKWSDQVRKMKVGGNLDITKKGRGAALTQAKLAFRAASFKTQQHEGKLYLIRTE
jgi:hypothetical protein